MKYDEELAKKGMDRDSFFDIETKQDVDDIIDKLDNQLLKIYEMNMFYNLRDTDKGTSGARIISKNKSKMRSPISSASRIKEKIIGNFTMRRKERILSSRIAKMNNRRRI